MAACGAGKAFPLNYISRVGNFRGYFGAFPSYSARLRPAGFEPLPAKDSDPTVLDDIPAPAVPPAGSDPCRFQKQKGYPMSITAERKQALITEYATGAGRYRLARGPGRDPLGAHRQPDRALQDPRQGQPFPARAAQAGEPAPQSARLSEQDRRGALPLPSSSASGCGARRGRDCARRHGAAAVAIDGPEQGPWQDRRTLSPDTSRKLLAVLPMARLRVRPTYEKE